MPRKTRQHPLEGGVPERASMRPRPDAAENRVGDAIYIDAAGALQ